MRWLILTALTALLAGCASSGPAQRYFVLDAGAASTAVTPASREATLLVAPVSAASFYRGRELVYSSAAGTRAVYQFSSWTEPPAQAIGSALITRLERSGGFRSVAAIGSGSSGTLLLRVHLDEIYHDAATPPGVARIVLSAQLNETSGRARLDQRTFSVAVPAASYDADGAVSALRQALDQVLDELVRWVAATAR
jgi:cholesterol transport system auxiliary component